VTDIDKVIYQDCAMILATYESLVDLDYPRQPGPPSANATIRGSFPPSWRNLEISCFPNPVRPTGNERFFLLIRDSSKLITGLAETAFGQ
jgi:hypothetical protein